MDFGATVSRALKITWEHKVLWILGFLAALGSGGTGSVGNIGRNPQITNRFSSGETPPWFNNLVSNPNTILSILAAIGCVVLLIGIVLWVVGLIARGGLIAGVQQIETDGDTTFGSAWKVGAAKFWRLLGLDILIALPVIIVGIVIVVMLAVSIGGIIAASSGGRSRASSDMLGMLGMLGITTISVICCLICLVVLYSLLAMAFQTFGERAIVIENMGVTASISRAWAVFGANLGNIILLALLMLVVSFVFGLVVGALALIVLAPTLLPLFLDTSRSGALSAGMLALAVIGLILVAILGAVVESVFVTFNSATWTLAYRQFIGIAPPTPAQPAAQPPLPAA
ncbi:MAG: hypothetical protein M1434_12575 [Chloroflexi bacterium]|nr:hypothetical protein [Chloroflexota bacterium]MCL5275558.1 hypothetical protein [Chloroflexota bacterium]